MRVCVGGALFKLTLAAVNSAIMCTFIFNKLWMCSICRKPQRGGLKLIHVAIMFHILLKVILLEATVVLQGSHQVLPLLNVHHNVFLT